MPESFGARLRRQREKHGIALEALAKQTRIKESLLEALERDDLSQWPSGFYRRAFFRAYASAIQLDPDAAFREFQQLHPEPPESDVLAAMAVTLGLEQRRDRSGIRSAVESAISSLVRLRPSTSGEQQVRAAEPTAAVEEFSAPGATSGAFTPAAAPEPAPAPEPTPEPKAAPVPEIELTEVAELCVEFGCIASEEETRSLLQQAARLIGAGGLIVWAVDPRESNLHAVLVHGYSPRVIAQLPAVRPGDSNATAEAFRKMQTRVFHDTASGKSALAIPLRTASGCVGVFAVELERGIEATKSRVAVATLLAAQLAPIADSLSQPMPLGLPRAVNGEMQTV
jgi:transcriptional regulator with XRE-family HTH domain